MGSKQSEGRRKMVVYPITGRQFWFLSVPHSWCRECDLTIRAVSSVAAEVGDTVEVEVKPWLRHVVEALLKGGWHAPVVTIDGRVFSQGVVPDPERLRAALQEEMSAP
jgi:hypothetical protein